MSKKIKTNYFLFIVQPQDFNSNNTYEKSRNKDSDKALQSEITQINYKGLTIKIGFSWVSGSSKLEIKCYDCPYYCYYIPLLTSLGGKQSIKGAALVLPRSTSMIMLWKELGTVLREKLELATWFLILEFLIPSLISDLKATALSLYSSGKEGRGQLMDTCFWTGLQLFSPKVPWSYQW